MQFYLKMLCLVCLVLSLGACGNEEASFDRKTIEGKWVCVSARIDNDSSDLVNGAWFEIDSSSLKTSLSTQLNLSEQEDKALPYALEVRDLVLTEAANKMKFHLEQLPDAQKKMRLSFDASPDGDAANSKHFELELEKQ